MFEEKYYEKSITPFYTAVPIGNEIAFKIQRYNSINSILVNFYIFIVKPRLKIGNKETDDITRKDFNKEVLSLRMYDVNKYKKGYLE